jgi:hypothetical protein
LHGALTQQANAIEGVEFNVHADLEKFASGQLPDLGS